MGIIRKPTQITCSGCKWEADRMVNYEPGKHPCDDCVRETKLVDKYEKREEKPKLPEKWNREYSSVIDDVWSKYNQLIDYLRSREND